VAERRYEEVDPANRLVAATLEQRWNEALRRLSELKGQLEQAQHEQARVATPEQKERVLALARDFRVGKELLKNARQAKYRSSTVGGALCNHRRNAKRALPESAAGSPRLVPP